MNKKGKKHDGIENYYINFELGILEKNKRTSESKTGSELQKSNKD